MNLREMIKNGFQKVMNYPRMKKILMVGFLLSSMFMLYAISNVLGVMTLDETQFVKINRDYIKVDNKRFFKALEKFKSKLYASR